MMIHLLTVSPLRSTPTLRFHRCRLPLRTRTRTGQGNRPGASAQDSPGDGKRRRGRPAHLRSPTDSPLRDGNRDRLVGLLTKRSPILIHSHKTASQISGDFVLLSNGDKYQPPSLAGGLYESTSNSASE